MRREAVTTTTTARRSPDLRRPIGDGRRRGDGPTRTVPTTVPVGRTGPSRRAPRRRLPTVHPTRSLVVGAVLGPLVLLGALGPTTWASAEPVSERPAPSVRAVLPSAAPSTSPEPEPQSDPAGIPLWQQVAGLATPASYAVPVPTDARYGAVSSRRVSFGVDVVEVRRSSPQLVAHVVRVSPGAAARLRSVAATDRVAGVRERTTSICARTACAVAVNGDYWDAQGRPVGLLVADGELYQSPPCSTPRPSWAPMVRRSSARCPGRRLCRSRPTPSRSMRSTAPSATGRSCSTRRGGVPPRAHRRAPAS
jgi:hypothetical protein